MLRNPYLPSLTAPEVCVVPTWTNDWRWERLSSGRRVPSKKAGRRGSRRAWKRRHPQGLRWRYGPVEPDHVLSAPGVIYCTARQYATIKDKLRAIA